MFNFDICQDTWESNILPLLSMRDLTSVAGTCRRYRGGVHEYWSKMSEALLNQTGAADAIGQDRRKIVQWVASHFAKEIEKVNRDLPRGLDRVWAFLRRGGKPRNERLCNPAIAIRGPGMIYSTYQRVYDRDVLVFANVIANTLGLQAFNSPDEAKVWLNNPINQNQLQGIERLDLPTRGLEILPAEIGLLTGLRNLDVYGNQLISLPTEIGQLAELEWLSIANNRLTSFPEEIMQLTKLKSFHMSFNSIEDLPAEIMQWKNSIKMVTDHPQHRTS